MLKAFVLLSLLAGCAIYSQDLGRIRRHYQENEYEKSLALCRVLEVDLDSLSPSERTQYAYLRGMTDYRLSSLVPAGTGVVDPRGAYRDESRHWLALSSVLERSQPGGLSESEKQRLNETLAELNNEKFSAISE